MRSQESEEDNRVLLSNNPFVPPTGYVCFINNLPPELLSRIFEFGVEDDEGEEEDDSDLANYIDTIHNCLDGTNADEKNISNDDSKVWEDHDVTDWGNGEGEEANDDDDDNDDDTGSSDFSDLWPPFQICVSHVCRLWRNTAIATPALWTTIDVTQNIRLPYDSVSRMLERSKSLPIDVSVSWESREDESSSETNTTNGDGPPDERLVSLCCLLVPHVYRFRTICVSVSEYRHMYAFLNAVSSSSISPALQLTSLELRHEEETEEYFSFSPRSMSKHFVIFDGTAPRLTSIILWGVHVDWNQPWITSASNLIELELAYHSEDVRPSWAQFASILRGAPVLEALRLRLSGPSGDPVEWLIEPTPGGPTDLNAPIQLLKVTDFTLAFHSPTRAIGLLRKFHLPALKNLVLDFDDGDYTDFVAELAGPATSLYPSSAQEQSRSLLSSLECLEIAGLPCNPECIKTLYGELQNVTMLDISLHYLSTEFLDLLSETCTLPGRGDVWLPRLTTLYVSGSSGDALRGVVQKRRDAGVPLESLHVEESPELDEEDVEWLQDNLDTFDFFEGSDDEDVEEEIDEWSDMD